MMYLSDRLPIANYPTGPKNKTNEDIKLPQLNEASKKEKKKEDKLKKEKQQLIEETRQALKKNKTVKEPELIEVQQEESDQQSQIP